MLRLRRARALSPPQRRAAALPAPPQGPTAIPDDLQLLSADTNPTLRLPVGHSSLNWTLIKPRIRASYGWLEISRGAVRYIMIRPSRITKEADSGFDVSRAEITDLQMEFGAAQFRSNKLRHFFSYSPQNHWDAADSADTSVNSIAKSDAFYSPMIVQALQNFDGVVAEVKAKQRPVAPPPVVTQPPVVPVVNPTPPPPPPTVVVMAPSGVGENQTVELNESPLTIRGVAMSNSGLPTITINGAPAALRPKGADVAEFWSDPLTLKPGDNPFEIVATSAAQSKSNFHFVAHFTPKATPPNPHALGKEEIISLLQGGVPNPRVAELIKERGIKFAPTSGDFNDIRAAGGSEEVIQAIQQAAAPAK